MKFSETTIVDEGKQGKRKETQVDLTGIEVFPRLFQDPPGHKKNKHKNTCSPFDTAREVKHECRNSKNHHQRQPSFAHGARTPRVDGNPFRINFVGIRVFCHDSFCEPGFQIPFQVPKDADINVRGRVVGELERL